jgi:hypothetical protein
MTYYLIPFELIRLFHLLILQILSYILVSLILSLYPTIFIELISFYLATSQEKGAMGDSIKRSHPEPLQDGSLHYFYFLFLVLVLTS